MSPAVRLSLFYALTFCMVGVYQPFWPIWLAGRGLGADQIGLVLGIASAAKIVSIPFWTGLADRRGNAKRVVVLLAAATVTVYLGYLATSVFALLLLLAVAATAVFSPVIPLTDTMALAFARRGAVDYGRVRLWGSIAFIASSLATGWLITGRSSEVVLWLMIGCYSAILTGSLALPASSEPPGPPRSLIAGAGPVLGNPGMCMMFLATGLIQGSHAVYYGFGALDWRAAGHSETVIGWLWAEGVVCEILLFAFARRVAGGLGAAGLIALGGGVAAVRWVATGVSADIGVLAIVQAMHAFSFAATHLGAMAYLQTRSPTGLTATAQGLYSALPMGAGSGLAVALAGYLYGSAGPLAYQVMAGMAAAGALAALRLR